MKSILAGILIGIGVIINTISSIPELGAFLFSFGLLSIIYLQLSLYTGKIGFLAKDLPQMLLGNLIGSGFIVGLYEIANPAFLITFQEKAAIKFTKGYIAILIYAFFCGMLIHFAVKQKGGAITVIMAIMIFIHIWFPKLS
jgi:formate/nitrite transporter FocA (FNT family)